MGRKGGGCEEGKEGGREGGKEGGRVRGREGGRERERKGGRGRGTVRRGRGKRERNYTLGVACISV